MKHHGVNATAIALNITDEHFVFTMQSVGASKVDKMIVESEFQMEASRYCDELDEDARKYKRVDFLEVVDGKIYGYCLDSDAEALFEDIKYIDEQAEFVAKMMIIAHRWYKTPIAIDDIPTLIG